MPEDHRNDHFVPRTYLKRFTSGRGLHLFSYNKASDDLKLESIKNVASEWDFSTLPEELVGQGNGRGLEAKMEKFDRQFARDRDELVRLAATGGTIGAALKVSLSNFISSQFYRTRYYRQLMKGAVETAIARGDFYNLGPPWVNDGKMSADLVSYIQARNILAHSQDLADIYHNTEWLLGINQTPLTFFTSDAPVVQVPPPGRADPKGGDRWYAFPITPELLLRMFPLSTGYGTPEIRQRVITNENHVAHYNWVQIDQSHLTVFSNVEHADFCHLFCELHPTVRDPHWPTQQGVDLMNADWVREIGTRMKSQGA